jgi:hypothetical protein
VLAGLLAGVLGLAVALLGLFAHRDTTQVAGVELPWGLAVALLTAFALVCAAGARAGASGAACAAAGWVVCVLLALSGRPEGDYLLAADAVGQGYLWGGLATVAVAFAVAVRLKPPPVAEPSGGAPVRSRGEQRPRQG